MFGIHISKQFDLGNYSSITDAIDDVTHTYNLDICQIFLYGPQSRIQGKYNEDVLKKLSKRIGIYVHSTYLTDGYWSAVESGIESKLNSYYKHIQDQLSATDRIDGLGLVIHITRKPINILVHGMKLLEKNIKQNNVKIILEFKAMKASEHCSYERPEQINRLCKAMEKNKLNWGLCIDTAHMWSTGIKMQELNIIKKWFADLTYPRKIMLFHLNAAENNTYNTGRDVHIVPFAHNDNIWGNITTAKSYEKLSDADYAKIKKSSLGFLLKWAKKNKVPIIGEFKRGKKLEFEFAMNICRAILQ